MGDDLLKEAPQPLKDIEAINGLNPLFPEEARHPTPLEQLHKEIEERNKQREMKKQLFYSNEKIKIEKVAAVYQEQQAIKEALEE